MATKLNLRLYEKVGAIYVETDLPALVDPENSMLGSEVSIMVPRANQVVLSSSFGTASISDLTGGARLAARNATMEVNNIQGDIKVTSSMSTVQLAGVSGRMEISNAYGTVDVTGCRSEMEIENEYGVLNIVDCQGKASVRTSGTTKVSGFGGDIGISGTAGAVEIRDVTGDVRAATSYQTLLARDIKGSTQIQNTYGTIKAVDIEGPLDAVSFQGDIIAISPLGPVNFSGRKGKVEISLDDQLLGESSITMHQGSILLRPDVESDLRIIVTSDGGRLVSSYPTTETGSGATKIQTITIGRGTHRLTLAGDGTKIVVEKP
jgi:hypothetical protein